MPLEPSRWPIEPWSSFLQDLDDELSEQTTLYCMGGFAAVQAYGLNFERDRADVEHLAHRGLLNASILRERYQVEMRPYVTGRVSWHDQTLEMWIAAFLPEKGDRS